MTRAVTRTVNPHLLPVRRMLIARHAVLDMNRERVLADVNGAEETLQEVADGLTLTAIPQLCSDGMSDRLFGMRAHVVIHGDAPRMLSGCCSIQP